MTALIQTPAHAFLAGLGTSLQARPIAILVISAHWETSRPMLTAVAGNETIHDFYGFPKALYELNYTPPGDQNLASEIATQLQAAGFDAGLEARGLDHVAWVPLLLAFPEADIPVLQLSVQTHLGTAHHLRLGAALAGLRGQGVLIIGSGSFTHDLRRFRGNAALDAPETEDVAEFSDWMDENLRTHNVAALEHYRKLAPHAADEHPTEEHLLPLHVAIAAIGQHARTTRLHRSVEFGFMRMDAYAFGGD